VRRVWGLGFRHVHTDCVHRLYAPVRCFSQGLGFRVHGYMRKRASERDLECGPEYVCHPHPHSYPPLQGPGKQEPPSPGQARGGPAACVPPTA
jgi:hypothetical protein